MHSFSLKSSIRRGVTNFYHESVGLIVYLIIFLLPASSNFKFLDYKSWWVFHSREELITTDTNLNSMDESKSLTQYRHLHWPPPKLGRDELYSNALHPYDLTATHNPVITFVCKSHCVFSYWLPPLRLDQVCTPATSSNKQQAGMEQ